MPLSQVAHTQAIEQDKRVASPPRGPLVDIQEGAFAGMEGTLELDNLAFAVVRISIFGRPALLALEWSDITPSKKG